MMPMKTNQAIRQATKPIVKKNFWRICGMWLLTMLVTVAIMLVVSFAMMAIIGVDMTSANPTFTPTYSETAVTLLTILPLVLMLCVYVITSGMQLGFCNGILGMVRGEKVYATAVFSRMGKCLKGFGLTVLMGLKVFLWALPGFAVMLIGSFISLNGGSEEGMSLLMWAGYVLVFALMLPALLRYAMSYYVMAENPDRGIRASIARSKEIMQYRKWQLFKLDIPYFLISYAVIMVLGVVVGFVSSVVDSELVMGLTVLVTLIVMIAVMLRYMAYVQVATGVFYDVCGTTEDQGEQGESSEG
ncbi:MAG: DUF975 family protein [Clostridia bacterium]|nr:DUF975 family protein [Clostridia bacterium]